MKIWILVNLFVLALSFGAPAFAQNAMDKIPVPLAPSEMKIILQMCEAAKFGYRAEFEPICPQIKDAFDAAKTADEKKKETPPE